MGGDSGVGAQTHVGVLSGFDFCSGGHRMWVSVVASEMSPKGFMEAPVARVEIHLHFHVVEGEKKNQHKLNPPGATLLVPCRRPSICTTFLGRSVIIPTDSGGKYGAERLRGLRRFQ